MTQSRIIFLSSLCRVLFPLCVYNLAGTQPTLVTVAHLSLSSSPSISHNRQPQTSTAEGFILSPAIAARGGQVAIYAQSAPGSGRTIAQQDHEPRNNQHGPQMGGLPPPMAQSTTSFLHRKIVIEDMIAQIEVCSAVIVMSGEWACCCPPGCLRLPTEGPCILITSSVPYRMPSGRRVSRSTYDVRYIFGQLTNINCQLGMKKHAW